MRSREIGWLLVTVGAGALVFGVLVLTGSFSWFGRLPGDIRFEGERVRFYFPITSMLLLSVVLSVVVWLARRVSGH